MTTKGFAETNTNIATPNAISISEKPLKTNPIRPQRVDINELKEKLQMKESREFKKNITILSALIIGLGIVGIYLSL